VHQLYPLQHLRPKYLQEELLEALLLEELLLEALLLEAFLLEELRHHRPAVQTSYYKFVESFFEATSQLPRLVQLAGLAELAGLAAR